MSAQPSIGTMLQRIHGLCGTKDVSAWEDKFIRDVYEQSQSGTRTSRLSEKQVEKIAQIFERHFAA